MKTTKKERINIFLIKDKIKINTSVISNDGLPVCFYPVYVFEENCNLHDFEESIFHCFSESEKLIDFGDEGIGKIHKEYSLIINKLMGENSSDANFLLKKSSKILTIDMIEINNFSKEGDINTINKLEITPIEWTKKFGSFAGYAKENEVIELEVTHKSKSEIANVILNHVRS